MKIHLHNAVLLYTKIPIINTAIQRKVKLQFCQQTETFSVLPFTGETFSCILLRCHKRSSTWIIYIILLHCWYYFRTSRTDCGYLLICNVQLKIHTNIPDPVAILRWKCKVRQEDYIFQNQFLVIMLQLLLIPCLNTDMKWLMWTRGRSLNGCLTRTQTAWYQS